MNNIVIPYLINILYLKGMRLFIHKHRDVMVENLYDDLICIGMTDQQIRRLTGRLTDN